MRIHCTYQPTMATKTFSFYHQSACPKDGQIWQHLTLQLPRERERDRLITYYYSYLNLLQIHTAVLVHLDSIH